MFIKTFFKFYTILEYNYALTTPFTKPISTQGKIAVEPVCAVIIVKFFVTKIDELEDTQSLAGNFLCLCLMM